MSLLIATVSRTLPTLCCLSEMGLSEWCWRWGDRYSFCFGCSTAFFRWSAAVIFCAFSEEKGSPAQGIYLSEADGGTETKIDAFCLLLFRPILKDHSWSEPVIAIQETPLQWRSAFFKVCFRSKAFFIWTKCFFGSGLVRVSVDIYWKIPVSSPASLRFLSFQVGLLLPELTCVWHSG